MAYLIIWQRKKKVYSCGESYVKGNRQFKFCTVVTEVSQAYVPSEQEDKLWLNALKLEETTKIGDNRVCALHLIFNK